MLFAHLQLSACIVCGRFWIAVPDDPGLKQYLKGSLNKTTQLESSL